MDDYTTEYFRQQDQEVAKLAALIKGADATAVALWITSYGAKAAGLENYLNRQSSNEGSSKVVARKG
jgi:hypothetical protein